MRPHFRVFRVLARQTTKKRETAGSVQQNSSSCASRCGTQSPPTLPCRYLILFAGFLIFFANNFFSCLRMVPTIVTARIFCACQGSRAQRETNVQQTGHANWFCRL